MEREVLDVKYYVLKDSSATPEENTYVKIITKQGQGQKFYSFVSFVLIKDGTVKLRDTLVDLTAMKANRLVETVQTHLEEIPKEEFQKAEKEYLNREAELNVARRESDVFHKYFGIDIVRPEQKDIMERVSKSLKKPKET